VGRGQFIYLVLQRVGNACLEGTVEVDRCQLFRGFYIIQKWCKPFLQLCQELRITHIGKVVVACKKLPGKTDTLLPVAQCSVPRQQAQLRFPDLFQQDFLYGFRIWFGERFAGQQQLLVVGLRFGNDKSAILIPG